MATARGKGGAKRGKPTAAGTAKRSTALPLFIAGWSNTGIAAALDVSEFTVSGWRNEPEMAAAIEEAHARARAAAAAGLEALTEKAVSVLDDLLLSGEDTVRLGAVKVVLEYTKPKPAAAVDLSVSTGPLTQEQQDAVVAMAIREMKGKAA